MEYDINLSTLNYIDKTVVDNAFISSISGDYGIDIAEYLSTYLYVDSNDTLSCKIFSEEMNSIKSAINVNAINSQNALTTIFYKLLYDIEEDDLMNRIDKLKNRKLDKL